MDSADMPSPSIVLVLFAPAALGLAAAAWLWYAGVVTKMPLAAVRRTLGRMALALAITAWWTAPSPCCATARATSTVRCTTWGMVGDGVAGPGGSCAGELAARETPVNRNGAPALCAGAPLTEEFGDMTQFGRIQLGSCPEFRLQRMAAYSDALSPSPSATSASSSSSISFARSWNPRSLNRAMNAIPATTVSTIGTIKIFGHAHEAGST